MHTSNLFNRNREPAVVDRSEEFLALPFSTLVPQNELDENTKDSAEQESSITSYPMMETSVSKRNRGLIDPQRITGEPDNDEDDTDFENDEINGDNTFKPEITFKEISPDETSKTENNLPSQTSQIKPLEEPKDPKAKKKKKQKRNRKSNVSEHKDENEEQEKNVTINGSLFSFARFPEDLVYLIPAIIVTCAAGVGQPLQTILMGKVFTSLSKFSTGLVYDSPREFMKDVTTYTMSIIGLSGAILLFQTFMVAIWDYFSSVQVRRAQEKTYFRFLGRDFAWYDKNKGIMGTLALLNRSFEDYKIATSMNLALNIRSVSCIISALIIAFVFNWSLTFISLCSLPVIIIFTGVTATPMTKALAQYKAIIEDASSLINWSITSITTVKQFNAQYVQIRKLNTLLDDAFTHYKRFIVFAGLQQGISRFIMLTMFVPAFVYGGKLVAKGKVYPGDVLTVFWSTMMIANSLSELGLRMEPLHKGIVASSRIKEFLDLGMSSSTYFKSMIGLFPESCKGSVVFQNVHFSYPSRSDVKVLRGLNLDISAGQTVFIVGNSGCGKSTISNIILRLYSILKGVVLVDGYPIETLSAKWLLNNITVVEQQSVLFNTTIKENIALGNCIRGTEMTTTQLESSISFAMLKNIIESTSKGLDSVVGAGGSRLSGGQRQRVALARARVRETPILILDESLSALDIRSRDIILRNIREWRKGKTTIIITHELDQIKADDYVYVFHKGKNLAQGLRKDLNDCKFFFGKTNSLMINDNLSSVSSSSSHSPFSDYYQMSLRSSRRETVHIMDTFSEAVSDDFSSINEIQGKEAPLNTDPRGEKLKNNRLSTVRPLSSFYPSLLLIDPKGEESIHNLLESGNRNMNEIRRFSEPPTPYTPTNQFVFDNVECKPEKQTAFKLGYINPKDTRGLPIPTLSVLYRCFQTVQNKPILFFGIFIAIINGAVNPIFSFAIAKIFTSMFPGSSTGSNSKWITLAILIALIDLVTIYLRTTVLCLAADRWVRSIRLRAFESVTSRDVSWFADNKIDSGELTTLLMNNTEDIRVIITLFLTVLSTCVSLSLICIIWVMVMGWKLCFVALSLIPGSYLSYLTFKYFNNIWEAQVISMGARVDGIIYEMVSGIRTLRILGVEKYFNDAFKHSTSQYSLLKLKDSMCKGIGFAISDFFPLTCQGILLYFGMKLVADGEYTLDQVMVIFTILLFSITSISVLMTAIPQMNVPLLTVIRLFHFLDDNSDINQEKTGQKIKMSLTSSTIVFKDLCFSYTTPKEISSLANSDDSSDDEDFAFTSKIESTRPMSSFSLFAPDKLKDSVITTSENVKKVNQKKEGKNRFKFILNGLRPFYQSKNKTLELKLFEKAAKRRIVEVPILFNINTTIPKNSVVAIVGPSGSGKSTLTSLLTKLYFPTSGVITIGGVDITDIDTDSLRSEIAVVGQMPLNFFRGTICENLTFGLNANISMDDIRKVCQDCAIDDFISSLPDKYDTMIGGSTGQVSSGASNLMSGGQMQRIGLARALLRQPRVLILDECTSGLDSKSTATILAKLEAYKQKRTMTIIIITHQKEPTKIADIIITLSQGHISRHDIKNNKFARQSLDTY